MGGAEQKRRRQPRRWVSHLVSSGVMVRGRAALIRTAGPTGVGREPLVGTMHQRSCERELELPFRGLPFSPGHTPLLIQPWGSSKPPGMRRGPPNTRSCCSTLDEAAASRFSSDLPGPRSWLGPSLRSHLKLQLRRAWDSGGPGQGQLQWETHRAWGLKTRLCTLCPNSGNRSLLWASMFPVC